MNALTADKLLKETVISPSTNSNFVTFSVTDRYPARAQALATAYARQFVRWSNALAVKGIPAKIASLQSQLKPR